MARRIDAKAKIVMVKVKDTNGHLKKAKNVKEEDHISLGFVGVAITNMT